MIFIIGKEVASFISNFVIQFKEKEATAKLVEQESPDVAQSTTTADVQYFKLNNKELKALCKSKGLKQIGNKADLVA